MYALYKYYYKKGVIMRVRKVGMCLMAAAVLLTAGCSMKLEKTAVTPDDFASAVEAVGLEVYDDTDSYEPEVGITVSIYGVDDDHTESYEFYTFDSSDSAEAQYESLKDQIENGDSENRTSSSFSGNNYSVYKATTDDVYYQVCVVDDTLFYGSAIPEKKSNIEDFAKKLGYN